MILRAIRDRPLIQGAICVTELERIIGPRHAPNNFDQAAERPAGAGPDDLFKRARQADTASHLDDWANSPGLEPPT
jgi:hypothetical protein